MNYRHAFHAGNFADLVKHAALLEVLGRLREGPPLTVVDTHAGRGLYDLEGPEARKSGEAAAGVVRLMGAAKAPAAFEELKAAVRALNGRGPIRRYPGSPWLIAQAIRPADRYFAAELRPEERAALQAVLNGRANVTVLGGDGYAAAPARTPPNGRALVLIDPPFERPDDYARIAESAAAVHRRNAQAILMVWLPLKDLATFDAFLGDLADAVRAPLLVAETRLRPLSDPMKMNGCALVFAGAPEALTAPLEAAAGWAAETLGQGGEARVYRA